MKKIYLFILPLFLLVITTLAIVHKTQAQTTCPITPTSSNTVTTTVTISQEGTYKVWSRIVAPNAVNNSYFLQIDDGCALNIGDSSSIPATAGAWVDYQDGTATNAALVTLTAGEHIIKITERESGVGIDRLLFSADLDCVPVDLGETCALPTATPVPPTSTPTPTPTPAPSMTVNSITMSYTQSGNKRNVTTTIAVKSEQTGAAIASATVQMSLRSPSGSISTFSGATNSSGQVSFTKSYNKETGTFQATITNVTKSGIIYNPTNTVQTLVVN